jgi:hypothetical protein
VTSLFTALLLVAAPKDLLREEHFNYRVRGELPPSVRREGSDPVFSFSIEGIPHGQFRFHRERLEAPADPRKVMPQRSPSYRFPATPADAKETLSDATWGGQPALLYELETRIGGIACRRRVLAMQAKSVWYELFETSFGDAANEAEFLAARKVFVEGFRLLSPPIPAGAAPDGAPLSDPELGWSLQPPKGFLRIEPDAVRDPGCVAAFERVGVRPTQRALVRFFEYGLRPSLDLKEWFGTLFGDFAARHEGALREEVAAPALRGAPEVHAALFRAGKVSARLWVARTAEGRLFSLQVREEDGAGEAFAADLAPLDASIVLAP